MEEPTTTINTHTRLYEHDDPVTTYTYNTLNPVPGTANAYPLQMAPQFADASPLPQSHDALVSTIRGIVREEMKSMLEALGQQIRAQGSVARDES